MVEVFDFQKNFKTGKEIRKSKFKDNAMTKGVATIELFDKNNNLVEKTVSNNFINNPFDSDYIYRHMANLLSGYKHDKCNIFNSEQFGQIQLRSGDFDEDPSKVFMRGEVVGWCPRTSSTVNEDVTRGIYNTEESFEEYTDDGYYHAHLVYDFLTSQGNGTINHVYWTPAIMDNSSKVAEGCLTPVNINPKHSQPYIIETGYKGKIFLDVKEDLYLYEDSKYYKIQNKLQLLNGLKQAVVDKNAPIDKIIGQYQRINSDLYVDYECNYAKGNASTRTCSLTLKLINTKTDEIQKTVSFDIINDFADIKNWSDGTTSTSSYAYIKHIKTCTESGNVYLCLYMYGGTLPAINEDGSTGASASNREYVIVYNILKDTWTIAPNRYSYPSYNLASSWNSNYPQMLSIKVEDDFYYLLPNSVTADSQSYNASRLDETKLIIANTYLTYFTNTFPSSSLQYYANCTVGYDYKTNTMIGKYGSTTGYIMANRFLPYSSHTKLPSPVTKTNTTTMKVTYDYYIQVPNMFAEKGEEFTWE